MNLPPFKMDYEEMVSHELLKLQYDCSLAGHASFVPQFFRKQAIDFVTKPLYGSKISFPDVFLPCISVCTLAASSKGYVPPIVSLS